MYQFQTYGERSENNTVIQLNMRVSILLIKKKIQKDQQRSTKHTHRTKDRVTRTPLKPGLSLGVPEG
jgi:hypothetical protein